jgi:hypothetical protein
VAYTIGLDAAESPPVNSAPLYDGKAEGIDDGSSLLIVNTTGALEVMVAVTGGGVFGARLLIPASNGIDVPGESELIPSTDTGGSDERAASTNSPTGESVDASSTVGSTGDVGATGDADSTGVAAGDMAGEESSAMALTNNIREKRINRNANMFDNCDDMYNLWQRRIYTYFFGWRETWCHAIWNFHPLCMTFESRKICVFLSRCSMYTQINLSEKNRFEQLAPKIDRKDTCIHFFVTIVHTLVPK